LHTPPLRDWHQNSGLHAALGHHLRSFGYTGVQQFAESGFGVLDWPCGQGHEDLHLTIYLTSLMDFFSKVMSHAFFTTPIPAAQKLGSLVVGFLEI
jgi:hypothetical protein